MAAAADSAAAVAAAAAPDAAPGAPAPTSAGHGSGYTAGVVKVRVEISAWDGFAAPQGTHDQPRRRAPVGRSDGGVPQVENISPLLQEPNLRQFFGLIGFVRRVHWTTTYGRCTDRLSPCAVTLNRHALNPLIVPLRTQPGYVQVWRPARVSAAV